MIFEERETFEDISIVTMCFNMGMKELSSIKGNDRKKYCDYYVKSVIKLCHLFRNVIVFCDEECQEYLSREGFEHAPYIVTMRLEDLEKMKNVDLYTKTYEHMVEVLKRREKYNILRRKKVNLWSPVVKKGVLPRNIARYTVLNHSKIDCICEASRINPFRTNYFYWIDGGCLQEKYSLFWKNWDGKIMHKPNGFRCALHIKNWTRMRLPLWTKKEIAFCFCEDQMIAGFFGMDKDCCYIVKSVFDTTVNEFLKSELMTYEQGIITWMIKKHRTLFDLVRSNHYDDVVNNVANGDTLYL